jgi:hypothetical protein
MVGLGRDCGQRRARNLFVVHGVSLFNVVIIVVSARPRYSILPAITTSGIIYSHIKTGSYNGEQFLDWLEGLLQVVNPYPAPHSVLILDNCRIHHVEGVAEMCEER